MCSEALANVAKHAHATSARCDVSATARFCTCRSPTTASVAPTRGSAGLRGLADRVEALGGRLRVSSPPDAGTTITVALPLDRGTA